MKNEYLVFFYNKEKKSLSNFVKQKKEKIMKTKKLQVKGLRKPRDDLYNLMNDSILSQSEKI